MSSSESQLKNHVELLVLGWIRLFIEKKVHNIAIECTDFFGALIDSKTLDTREESVLL